MNLLAVAYRPAVANFLIDSLPLRERNEILAQCKTVNLSFGDVLCDTQQPITQVLFPLTGIISLLAATKDHPAMELGMIGNEGIFGATVALGSWISPLRAIVQGPGTALQIDPENFQNILLSCPQLARTINTYLYVLISQLSFSVSCTQFHSVELRLARWLLMTHDRAHANHFRLTHQFLADMLGVRRSAITIAAGALQKRKLITYSRGDIHVVSRSGLETASCECYAKSVQSNADLPGRTKKSRADNSRPGIGWQNH